MSTRSLRYSSQGSNLPKGRMASGSDRDAGAFIEAATIYDSRQQRAIYELVRLLKQYGIWSKMKAIYPFVGGTATTHKWNLKDPQDTDAAFRLTFNGGWTHSSTGIDANGSSGWAKTYYIPKDQATLGSVSYGCYVRENDDYSSGGSLNDLGCGIASAASAHMAMLIRLSNTFYADCWQNSAGRVSTSNTDRRGFYIASRTSTTDFRAYKNGAQIGSTRTTLALQSNLDSLTMSFAICCFNQSGDIPTNYSKAEQAFAFIGTGLSSTECANFNYAVQRFQQILGRAV